MNASVYAALLAAGLLGRGILAAASPDAGEPGPGVGAPFPGMVLIEGGEYRPFYPVKGEEAQMLPPFWLDAHPVTNGDYLAFVASTPRWQRSQVAELFAGSRYLSHWAGDLELGDAAPPDAPVTFVSWFAASAYCRAQGRRLPAEAEWEYAARADATRRDASGDPEFRARISAWYARPHGGAPLGSVRESEPNAWGVRGLHGSIWEWVLDWNASLVSSDDRRRGDRDLGRFCGGGAVGASDVGDYPAFMRMAFRSSLEASYTLHHLGFRCARDAAPGEAPPPREGS